MSIIDNSIDLTGDSGVIKRLLVRGNPSKGYALQNDRVDIAWKIFTFPENGRTLVHDSRRDLSIESDGVILDENRNDSKLFQFRIAGSNQNIPREVILGWDIAVRSMFEGEISSFSLSPKVLMDP